MPEYIVLIPTTGPKRIHRFSGMGIPLNISNGNGTTLTPSASTARGSPGEGTIATNPAGRPVAGPSTPAAQESSSRFNVGSSSSQRSKADTNNVSSISSVAAPIHRSYRSHGVFIDTRAMQGLDASSTIQSSQTSSCRARRSSNPLQQSALANSIPLQTLPRNANVARGKVHQARS